MANKPPKIHSPGDTGKGDRSFALFESYLLTQAPGKSVIALCEHRIKLAALGAGGDDFLPLNLIATLL